jgi:O-antigen/teichoic acid export membrane protein
LFNISSQVKISTDSPSVKPDRNILTAAKGGGIVFAGVMFNYASRFVIGILLARFLGAEQFGLYNLALTAATVTAGLALLGLQSAMVRYVSFFASQRDTAGLWGTLQIGLGLPMILSVLMGGGLYALAGPIAERLFHEPRLASLLRLGSLIVPFLTLSDIIAAATRGFKKMQYTVIAQNIAQPMIRLVLIVTLAIIGLNAAGALAAFGLTVMIVSVLLLYFLNKLFSLKHPLRTAGRNLREMLSFSLPVYLSDLIRTFGGNLQTVLLGTLNTITSVGIFTAASQVNLVGRLFHRSIVTASMPIVSELYSQGEREQMGRFYQTMTKWTFTANLPLFLILLMFPVPILSIFGGSFVDGATALSILAWANLVNVGTGICGVLLDMSGNTSLKLANSIVTTVLTLGLNILLIPRWGLMGAATAALAAAIIANLLRLFEVYLLFRLLPYNLSFAKPVVAGLAALAAAWAAHQLFATEANLIYAFMNMTLLLTIYVGLILLLGLSQEDRAILARLRRRTGAVLSKTIN